MDNKYQKIIEKSQKKWEKFYKTHWKNDDDLTIVLKTHLYLENCLDEIFLCIIPNPKHFLDKKFYEKVKIFEAINIGPPSVQIVEKLLAINKVRNKFAHNIKYKITLKDLTPLLWDDQRKENINTIYLKLRFSLTQTISYMDAIRLILSILPFTMTCSGFKKIFKKEKGYNSKKIYKAIHPNNEAVNILESLKI